MNIGCVYDTDHSAQNNQAILCPDDNPNPIATDTNLITQRHAN